jgi:hypothetical protein
MRMGKRMRIINVLTERVGARPLNYRLSYSLLIPSLLLALICAMLTVLCPAQDIHPGKLTNPPALAENLSFGGPQTGVLPPGWNGSPAGTIFLDDKIVHGGHWAARIERHPGSPGISSSMSKSIEMDFGGRTIEFRGFLRTEDLNGSAGLLLREDGKSPGLALDTMQGQELKGTMQWGEYSIKLPIHPEARRLFFGVFLAGTGKAWADDLQLLVDGKPVWELPKFERAKTILDFDHRFDRGSGILLNELTKNQIENLATLGRVWGFLKYHHPQVTSGQRHWDYELFRILPAILDSRDRASANDVLLKWIAGLGEFAPCNPCVQLDESDLHFRPDVEWIGDEALLGAELSRKLRAIYRNRPDSARQFYVSPSPHIGNPVFEHELAYPNLKFPDTGFQLLSLYRFWNIIEYWSPYRDVVGENWYKVLIEFIPRIALAKDSEAYQRELFALIARVHDGHANLWSSLKIRPPVGDCQLPVNVRFIENRAVVTGYLATEAAKETGLMLGDILTEFDGVPVAKLIEAWTPYYAASNDSAQLRDIARSMTRGPCGELNAHVLREGHDDVQLKTKRVTITDPIPGGYTHDLPGATFRLLSSDVAYLKLSSVKSAEASHYIEAAAGTKGLIIDIRNYPSEFMVFALGSLLVGQETQFVRITLCDPSTPGAFHWKTTLSLSPQKPHYTGKVVILVDEVSQSQAEYTSMAFRAAPQAMVVGSTTAGADGNVSQFALPGGLRTMISGIGVFYPNKKPTQRIGIVPDVQVQPTIAGIRSGRDEVLEEALRQILGRDFASQEIEKMSKP